MTNQHGGHGEPLREEEEGLARAARRADGGVPTIAVMDTTTRMRMGLALAVLTAAACLCQTPARAGGFPQVVGTQNAAAGADRGFSDDAKLAVAKHAEREIARQGLVALSVAVAKDGHIVHARHWGFEDREKSIPASEKTMYRWASISKPVTAIAAMQLVETGKLDLDKDVREYVKEWPEKPWPITTRQLLTHQGGIVHYTNGKVVASPKRVGVEHPYADVVDALGTFDLSPLVNEPGTKHSYTTHGYILVSAVVQRAGVEAFWEQVRERIAKPAGMATFRPDYQWEAIPNRAVGYRRGANVGKPEMVRSTDTDVSWKLGGGGFISTVEDMSRFSIALLTDRLVSGETRERMWTAQTTRDGTKTGYGLGFGIEGSGKEKGVMHSGAQEKTSTMLLMYPEHHVSVAIMTNTEGARLFELACDIADAVRGVGAPQKRSEELQPRPGEVKKP